MESLKCQYCMVITFENRFIPKWNVPGTMPTVTWPFRPGSPTSCNAAKKKTWLPPVQELTPELRPISESQTPSSDWAVVKNPSRVGVKALSWMPLLPTFCLSLTSLSVAFYVWFHGAVGSTLSFVSLSGPSSESFHSKLCHLTPGSRFNSHSHCTGQRDTLLDVNS